MQMAKARSLSSILFVEGSKTDSSFRSVPPGYLLRRPPHLFLRHLRRKGQISLHQRSGSYPRRRRIFVHRPVKISVRIPLQRSSPAAATDQGVEITIRIHQRCLSDRRHVFLLARFARRINWLQSRPGRQQRLRSLFLLVGILGIDPSEPSSEEDLAQERTGSSRTSNRIILVSHLHDLLLSSSSPSFSAHPSPSPSSYNQHRPSSRRTHAPSSSSEPSSKNHFDRKQSTLEEFVVAARGGGGRRSRV